MPPIDPIAFHLLGWPVRWYGLSYAIAFLCASFLIKRKSLDYTNKHNMPEIETKHFDNLITYCILGIILGGRLGHMVFYDFQTLIQNPIAILKTWEGGMAFHGGLLGCVLAAYLYVKKNKLPLTLFADLLALVTPLGIFFVRLANFVNQELYGRITDLPIGMIFKGDPHPRHPSQLYEAFLEGILLFFILNFVFKRYLAPKKQGLVCALFFLGYGIARFLVEYVREPSDGEFAILGVILTYGQLLTIPMIVYGIGHIRFSLHFEKP
ncbi:MAG: Phosphatidylglycerol--prolipoprotein diacylglyceryl transferase [Holosporales bacterium]